MPPKALQDAPQDFSKIPQKHPKTPRRLQDTPKMPQDAPKTIQKLDLEVFPNPASDLIQFNVDNTNNEELLIQVIDISGKSLISQTKKDQQLNIAGLSSGTYILSVQKNRTLYSSTFFKR